jgi:hypothetical protein
MHWRLISTQLQDWRVDPRSDRIVDSHPYAQIKRTAEMNPPAIPNTAHTNSRIQPKSDASALSLSLLCLPFAALLARVVLQLRSRRRRRSTPRRRGGNWVSGARIHGIPRLRGCPSRVPGRRPSLLQVLRWAPPRSNSVRSFVAGLGSDRSSVGFRVRAARIHADLAV